MSEDTKKQILDIVDRIFDSLDGFGTKILSGRFLATVLLVWTYCWVIVTCCRLVEGSKISPETFLAVMAGVGGLVTMIVKDYFSKDENKTGGTT
jgi:hypothetical protein